MTEGCVHIHIENGKIKNIFCHLSDLPDKGVVHLSPQLVMTNKEFKESHPHDSNELKVTDVRSIFDLADKSI